MNASEDEFYTEIVNVLNASTNYITTKQQLDRQNRNIQESTKNQNCKNCRWAGCRNYGKDRSTCNKYIRQ